MKKIIKFFCICVSFSLLFTKLNAMVLFSNSTNKIDLIGDFNFAYFNRLQSENTYDFIKNNKYHSHMGLLFENKTLQNLSSRLVFDVKINNKIYYPENIDKNYYKPLEVNELYVELEDASLGSIKIGNFNSQVIADTVNSTNKAYIFLLDAGYSFTGQSSGVFGSYADSYFSTEKIYQGIGHYNKISQVSIAVEVDSPIDNLQARNTFEENSLGDNLLSKQYSAGASLSYLGDSAGFSIGYKRIQNKVKKSYNSVDFNNDMINSDNILSSAYLSLNKFYLALAGGYYKNLKIAGINHVGASAFLSIQLTKLTPYIGYQFLYADNIHKNGDIYSLQNNKNYSFDQSTAVVGLAFKVYEGLVLGIEHNNDLRTRTQSLSSLLNNVNNDITTIYLKYSF